MAISPADDTHHSVSKNIRTNFKVFSHLKIKKVCYPLGTRLGPKRIFCLPDTEFCNMSNSVIDFSLRAINRSHQIIQYLLWFTRRRASRHSSVSVLTRLRAGYKRYRGSLPVGNKIITYSPKLRTTLGLNRLFFQWAPEGGGFLQIYRMWTGPLTSS